MTDQRDTPDTRTPSAEGCGHDQHETAESTGRWGRRLTEDAPPTPWEPCPLPGQGSWMPDQPASYRASGDPTLSDAPSAPNRAPTDEALTGQEREVIVGALDNFVGAYEKDPGVDPAYVAVARSARAKITTPAPTEGTADRDAPVERLGPQDAIQRLVAALEDLTRENERLRAFADEWGGFVACACPRGHVVAVDDGDGGSYACPLCQVAAVREALASIEYNARSALAALDRGSFNREDASLRADYEWFATTAGAALDTASEDRGDSQGAVRDG